MNRSELSDRLEHTALRLYGAGLSQLTDKQAYRALCSVVRDLLSGQHWSSRTQNRGRKQVCYFSMEFLTGPFLHNHLYNLGIESAVRDLLEEAGLDLDRLFAMEPDAGLGNGGLGRLAASYLEALTTLDYPATGYCILYQFGIFRQKIVDGWQVEFPDDWLELGNVWLTPREDDAVAVRFGGNTRPWDDNGKLRVAHENAWTVLAVPWDLYLPGYHSGTVNRLVLWSAKSPEHLDMGAFSRGDYVKALEQNTMAEVLSKVLYPADDHIEGKRLRLRQQYLLVSASLQSILAAHKREYGSLDNLPDKTAIHINDTHPALCVPELMRLLVDDYDYPWEQAWAIAQRTLSYTNHTVMHEALEHWSEDLFRQELPRVYEIVLEINRRLMESLHARYGSDRGKLEYMAPVAQGQVKMENLCLAACHRVNGVSQLHTRILTQGIFRDYYQLDPDRFINVTNGISYRRWLCQANPRLTALLTELIGDGFVHDSRELEHLLQYREDNGVLIQLQTVKRANKEDLTGYIQQANGVKVDPASLFDVQIKRLHEYKRQLLNALHILHLYLELKASPEMEFVPRTFLFAAKASPGYQMAKQIIRLIVAISRLVASEPKVREKLQVVFLEDYRVSLAQRIIPAAEVSEQISVAGKEASGTGNMKLMLNGALTLGTMDGANVEICQQVGDENLFLFGMDASQTAQLQRQGYDPQAFLRGDPALQEVFALLNRGFGGMQFEQIVRSLRPKPQGDGDPYLCLADFADYARAQRRVSEVYQQPLQWNRMALVNIAHAGVFSSDRAAEVYARDIWKL